MKIEMIKNWIENLMKTEFYKSELKILWNWIENWMKTHMSKEALTNHHRWLFTLFQFTQKMLAMKFVDFLDITKNDISLASQRLRNVLSHQLWYVILKEQNMWLMIVLNMLITSWTNTKEQRLTLKTDNYLYYVFKGLDVVAFSLYHFPHYEQYCSARRNISLESTIM